MMNKRLRLVMPTMNM